MLMVKRSFIPVNSMIAGSAIVHFGPFLLEYRNEMIEEWKNFI